MIVRILNRLWAWLRRLPWAKIIEILANVTVILGAIAGVYLFFFHSSDAPDAASPSDPVTEQPSDD